VEQLKKKKQSKKARGKPAASARPPAPVKETLKRLEKHYPDATVTLDHKSPLELLVATILSAQCTDERVNIVTKSLFKKYRHPEDYLAVPQSELEQDIRQTGFFHNKAKSIRGAMQTIIERYDGKVPDTMEELLTLPGVARKTANVVLGNAFGKAVGVVVDTHVRRVAPRLGWTHEEKPEKIEHDLMELLPRENWIQTPHLLIAHGRKLCKPKPLCAECFLKDICPAAIIYLKA